MIKSLVLEVRMILPIRVISVPIAIIDVVPKRWSYILLNKIGLSLVSLIVESEGHLCT